MIDMTDYLKGRDKQYPEDFTDEIRANAMFTITRVNDLLRVSGFSRRVTSGWRPSSLNAKVPGAAKRSNHIMALACDLEDTDGKLDAWCVTNLDKLEGIGLWLESPTGTRGWCHLQVVAPKSGNRVFIP